MSDVKTLRKQLRNVVQEILPEVLTKELVAHLEAEMTKVISERLAKIEGNMRESLKMLDDRSKASLGYLVRQASAAPGLPTPEAPKDAPAVSDEE